MNKPFLVICLFSSALILSGCAALPKSDQDTTTIPASTESVAAMPTSPTSIPISETNEAEESKTFTARFEIYTNGTKRIFTEAKYHNQSPEVYIQNPDPSRINVTEKQITWNDFFTTLPFSLSKDCLVTGTKQTFCSDSTGTLRFFLNGIETPMALDLEIQENDFLKVEYN